MKKQRYELPPFLLPFDGFMFRESCGLGLDSSTNTFKIVCIFLKARSSPKTPDLVWKNLCTMVHVFGMNSWQEIPQVPCCLITGKAVFANGCLFWLTSFIDRPTHDGGRDCSLYELKQALRTWFQRFAGYAFQVASSSAFLHRVISSLHGEFAMTDLGSLNYFLGISTQRSSLGLFLSQSTYAEEILEFAHMQKCNTCRTLMYNESKLGADDALQYLTFTRPNILYAVEQVYLYMHDPRELHLVALKRILRYVRCTIDHGLQLHVSSTWYGEPWLKTWAKTPPENARTTPHMAFSRLAPTSPAQMVRENMARKQETPYRVVLSNSSAEAEYRCVANVVAETAWVHNLLRELHALLFTATLVYCDNISVIYLFTNPVQHQRTKHIKIDIHFVPDFVASMQGVMKFISWLSLSLSEMPLWPREQKAIKLLCLVRFCLSRSTFSRHITFDEDVFPFEFMTGTQLPNYDFLLINLLPAPNSTPTTSPQPPHVTTLAPFAPTEPIIGPTSSTQTTPLATPPSTPQRAQPDPPQTWPPRVTLGRLLPHARGLGFKPRREGFPSGAKKEWGLSPKAKVRVLHTAQLDVTVSSNH
nr:hypothetical protein [Tanacetum cinerariifolium]